MWGYTKVTKGLDGKTDVSSSHKVKSQQDNLSCVIVTVGHYALFFKLDSKHINNRDKTKNKNVGCDKLWPNNTDQLTDTVPNVYFLLYVIMVRWDTISFQSFVKVLFWVCGITELCDHSVILAIGNMKCSMTCSMEHLNWPSLRKSSLLSGARL